MKIATLEMPVDLGKDNKKAQNEFIRGYKSLDADIFIGPEYLWGETVNKGELESILSQFNSNKVAIPGTILNSQEDGVYNTAFVVKNGKLLHLYNKETTSSECNVLDNYQTGNNSSYSVAIDGKTFGIEICRDHGAARLKKHVDSVDVHLILANNMNISPTKLIGKEYALIVDGNSSSPYSGLLKNKESWVEGKKINNFTIYEL